MGIDSSVIEANASLKSLAERNTEEAYWSYVKKLAQAAGIDPEDDQAVRQFDRKRPAKKLSNEQFKNRHDPDAKISRQKGKTDLIYKPEHSVDMETGAIVQAQLVGAGQSDSVGLSQRINSLKECLARLEPKKGSVGWWPIATTTVWPMCVRSSRRASRSSSPMALLRSDSKSDCRGRSAEHFKRLDKVSTAKPVAASCDCEVNRSSAVLPISWTAAECVKQPCAANSICRSVTSGRRHVTISASYCAKSSVVELSRWLWLAP